MSKSKSTSGLGTFIAILGFAAFGTVVVCCGLANTPQRRAARDFERNYTTSAPTLDGVAPVMPEPVVVQAPAWAYTHKVDPMTQGTGRVAYLVSKNTLNLDFPYRGEQHATLVIRESPRDHSVDVIVQIERGQIMCKTYMDCMINVSFGDGQMQKFSGASAADHDSTVAFIVNSKRFVEKAKQTTTILVELVLYNEGTHIMTFESVSPLVWE